MLNNQQLTKTQAGFGYFLRYPKAVVILINHSLSISYKNSGWLWGEKSLPSVPLRCTSLHIKKPVLPKGGQFFPGSRKIPTGIIRYSISIVLIFILLQNCPHPNFHYVYPYPESEPFSREFGALSPRKCWFQRHFAIFPGESEPFSHESAALSPIVHTLQGTTSGPHRGTTEKPQGKWTKFPRIRCTSPGNDKKTSPGTIKVRGWIFS